GGSNAAATIAVDRAGRSTRRKASAPPSSRQTARTAQKTRIVLVGYGTRDSDPARRPGMQRATYPASWMPGGRWQMQFEDPPERPADPAVRRANLRRVAGL